MTSSNFTCDLYFSALFTRSSTPQRPFSLEIRSVVASCYQKRCCLSLLCTAMARCYSFDEPVTSPTQLCLPSLKSSINGCLFSPSRLPILNAAKPFMAELESHNGEPYERIVNDYIETHSFSRLRKQQELTQLPQKCLYSVAPLLVALSSYTFNNFSPFKTVMWDFINLWLYIKALPLA